MVPFQWASECMTQAWIHRAVVNVRKWKQRSAAQAKLAGVSETPAFILCRSFTALLLFISPERAKINVATVLVWMDAVAFTPPVGIKTRCAHCSREWESSNESLVFVCLCLLFCVLPSPGARTRTIAGLMKMCLKCFGWRERRERVGRR